MATERRLLRRNHIAEPQLQQLTSKDLVEHTINKLDDPKVCVHKKKLANNSVVFYDIRMFYSNVKQYQDAEKIRLYEFNEKEYYYQTE